MGNFTENLFKFLHLPIKIICAVAIASCIILFLPYDLAVKLYMESFRSTYGFAIGIVFIVSSSIILVTLCIPVTQYINKKLKNKVFYKNSNKRLNELSHYQKTIIYGLMLEVNYTSELPLNDGAVRGLESYLMITKAASQYPMNDMYNPVFPYMLQPWVIDRLNDNEDMKNTFKLAYEAFEWQ